MTMIEMAQKLKSQKSIRIRRANWRYGLFELRTCALNHVVYARFLGQAAY